MQEVLPNTEDLEEAALVEGARVRDPAAWTTIYDRHYQPLYRYIHARVFDGDTAADLASSVFVAAINSIGSYKYTGRPILAWLYRIARNTVADHQRRALGRRGLESVVAPVRTVSGILRREQPGRAVPATQWQPDGMAERLDLHRAVAALPESQRELLILRFLVGMSTEEIAGILGKERAAIYSLHARAITSLRQSLSDRTQPKRPGLPASDKSGHRGPINMV
jgi:RNA polymerase sigma-70 factor (ECF subfamily)